MFKKYWVQRCGPAPEQPLRLTPKDKNMPDAIGNRRWWTLGLFFLCYTVLYMARASVSMAGPSMISFYGWSKTEFGLVSTAFFLGYASTMVLGGILADKFGGGRVLCVAAVLWSVFVFITPLPLGIPLVLMIVVRAGCGMAQGVALPSMTSMIAKWVPKKESGSRVNSTRNRRTP